MLLAGVSIALVGSVMLGLVECLLAAAIVARKPHGEGIPGTLLTAAIGRAALTHAALWIPVMIVVALGYWGLVRRHPRASPVPALAAVFIVLAGSVVVCADLELVGWAKPTMLAAGLAAVFRAWPRHPRGEQGRSCRLFLQSLRSSLGSWALSLSSSLGFSAFFSSRSHVE